MSRLRKQHMKIDWDTLIDVNDHESARKAPLHEKSALVGRLGLMMLSVGAGAWRVRAAMNKVSRALDITCNADIGLLSIEYTCVSGAETYTNALSINTTGVNTDRLNHLRAFADDCAELSGRYSIRQLFDVLDGIEAAAGHYNALKLALAAAMACAAFTFLLGGGPVEMACAFFGAGTGNFLRKKMLQGHITLFANVAASVAAACLVYIGLFRAAEFLFGVSDVHQAGYICAMLFIIPGFPLITGGIDLAKLDLRSGFERILYALLIICVATITGWLCAFMFRFSPADFAAYDLHPLVTLLLRAVMSFLAVFGFSLMFNSTARMATTAALIGMAVNTVRLELLEFTAIPVALAAFLAALLSGLCASAIKKKSGYPRLTVTVPSVVIMVPGMYMYKGIYFFAAEDVATGSFWLAKAVMILCALCLGLIFARILTDQNFRISS